MSYNPAQPSPKPPLLPAAVSDATTQKGQPQGLSVCSALGGSEAEDTRFHHKSKCAPNRKASVLDGHELESQVSDNSGSTGYRLRALVSVASNAPPISQI